MLIRIDNEPFSLGSPRSSVEYVEGYLIDAYIRSFFHTYNQVPTFYDIVGLFEDAVELSHKVFFVSKFYNFPQEKYEMSWEFVEDVLDKSKIEFISMDGEHLNDSQGKLFLEWE